ncbi:hypothetical protein BZG36_00718 [Bifiguratus adelaidae]|uniref:Symplekin/Pta1 N-terminal domain-containing protein n=1 Tax=Bifiguratus adelaidae TaxID=1938954 RepID=A0A261Y720_9FUNG|nr:hypothetical protein BZG36_00718 [Bifiguratus adelaidae]
MDEQWLTSAERADKIRILEDYIGRTRESPDDVAFFATSSFVDTLVILIQDPVPSVLKNVVHASAGIYPYILRTVCDNEGEKNIWQTMQHIKETIIGLVAHGSDGVRIAVAKFLQTIIIAQSLSESSANESERVFSMSSIPPHHALLDKDNLAKESEEAVQLMLKALADNTATVITAIINTFPPLVKARPSYTPMILEALQRRHQAQPSAMSSAQARNISKLLKITITSFMRIETLASYRASILEALGAVGGNVAQFRPRERDRRDEELRKDALKRNLAQLQENAARSEDGTDGKRARLADGANDGKSSRSTPRVSTPIQNNMAVFAGFNFAALPLSIVIELIVGTLQNVSHEALAGAAKNHAAAVTGAANANVPIERNLTPTGARDPRARQVQETFENQAALSMDMDDSMAPESSLEIADVAPQIQNPVRFDDYEDETQMATPPTHPKQVVIPVKAEPAVHQPSMQERAVRSFRIQPYALKEAPALDSETSRKLVKETLLRMLTSDCDLCDRYDLYSVSLPSDLSTIPVNASTRSHGAADGEGVGRSTWISLLVRLVTTDFAATVQRAANLVKTEEDGSDGLMVKKEEDANGPENANGNLSAEDDQLDELRQVLLDHVAADLVKRFDLAMAWLHQEWTMRSSSSPTTTSTSAYYPVLRALVESACKTLPAKDRTVARIMLEAPDLDVGTIKVFTSSMEQGERFNPSVSILRDIGNARPGLKPTCIDVLLQYTSHPDMRKRAPPIIVLKNLVPDDEEWAPYIEESAIGLLKTLANDSPPSDQWTELETKQAIENAVDDEEAAQASREPFWNDKTILRRCEFFYALCTKKSELLKELLSVYVTSPSVVQEAIKQNIARMIKTINTTSPGLLQTIREFPPGGEPLIMRMLAYISEKGKYHQQHCFHLYPISDPVTATLSPELVQAVRDVHKERQLHDDFLLPISSKA